ncbi:hypothetical protein GSI_04778 [Ganoderma sinense ZZ0214-1]|uniref:Uncharacterized protein n=1 Tax=Ganoderma sinense ZZ0214-1 TaxID=1077348 RepID=A0A2G8SHY1_9APHY|nr:hypothetical protein GSI_04778 [Ganoderma sinense ZZ0214-1]
MASPSTPKSNPTSPKSSPRSKLNSTPKHDWVPDPEFYYELHTFQVDSVRFRIPTHHLAESPFFQKLFHVAAPSGPVETFCDIDHLEGVSATEAVLEFGSLVAGAAYYATGSPRLPHSDSSRAAHKQLKKFSTQVIRRSEDERDTASARNSGLSPKVCTSSPSSSSPGSVVATPPVLEVQRSAHLSLAYACQQARTLPPATLCQRVHRTPPSA